MTNENDQINPTIEETENDPDTESMQELENELKTILGMNGSTDDEEYGEDRAKVEERFNEAMNKMISMLAMEAVGPELENENTFFVAFRQNLGRMTALLAFGEEEKSKNMLPETLEVAEMSRTIDLNRIANALESRAEMEATITTLVKDGALNIDFGEIVDGEIEIGMKIDVASALES